jgi:hypothetical protein
MNYAVRVDASKHYTSLRWMNKHVQQSFRAFSSRIFKAAGQGVYIQGGL